MKFATRKVAANLMELLIATDEGNISFFLTPEECQHFCASLNADAIEIELDKTPIVPKPDDILGSLEENVAPAPKAGQVILPPGLRSDN